MFDTYGELMPRLQSWLITRFPRQPGDSDFVHRQAVRAKALDGLRGLLPAGLALQRRHLRLGPVLRARCCLKMRSHPLARGPLLRGSDADRAAQGDPVVPPARGRDRSRRGVVASTSPTPAAETDRVLERLWPDAVPGAPSRAARRRARRGPAGRLRPRGRGQAARRDLLLAVARCPRTRRSRRVRALVGRRAGGAPARLRRRPQEPAPPAGPGLRADRLPLRDRGRLRRLPGPPAAPPAHRRVAAARPPSSATRCPTWSSRPGRRPPSSSRSSAPGPLYDAMAGDFPLEAGYAVALALPRPLRHADERARGAAPDRAALRDPGPSRPTGASRSRCTGPSPSRPVTTPSPPPWCTSTTGGATSSDWRGSDAPRPGARGDGARKS